MQLPDWAIGTALIALVLTGVPTIGTIVTAIAKRRGSRSMASSPDPQLQQALEALQTRVGELEERVDFAERSLAQVRNRPALGAGPERQE